MIVDSSALIAILRAEPEAAMFADALSSRGPHYISAANYLETAIVIDAANDPVVSRSLDQLLKVAHVEVVAATAAHARLAREAYRDFGKGSRHPAQLNFGDCFAYALAKDRGEPLLFKGLDFAQTDVPSAL